MSLSKKDLDDMQPVIDKMVRKFLGFDEPTLVIAATTCLDKGYSKSKTISKLSVILDESQAKKFADKLFNTLDDYKSGSKHSKSRKRKEEAVSEEAVDKKKARRFDDPGPTNNSNNVVPVPEPGQPSPGQLTNDKIAEMMANAQKTIEDRKKQLMAAGVKMVTGTAPLRPPGLVTAPTISAMPASTAMSARMQMNDAREKAQRAAELQQQIQASLRNAGIVARAPAPTVGAINNVRPTAPAHPTPLILDEQGRTIDAKTGEMVQLTQHQPELKANIRAKRREQFKHVHDKPPEEISESKFFDGRVGMKPATRMRKGFKFHEQGKFEQLASRLRTKAQLDKLQNEIAQAAKKTGIASATKLAAILPKKELKEGEIPDVEWWDTVIMKNDNCYAENYKDQSNIVGMTHLIEHPSQMKPPAEPTKPVNIKVILTAKERKKLRRQQRNETQKELTEKIRLGLLPPPEPKVRMANLMRVLGTEAVQDPTKVEQHVREQMAKRQKAHEEANAARKLTKDQRRDKKIRKLKEDTSLGVHVSVYRVRNLHNPSKKFKIETNCQQLYMTGIVVLHKECNLVVVEGGPKQQKKFRRLMLHRIKWSEEKISPKDIGGETGDSDDEEEAKPNSCALVWEGEVKMRAFSEMKFKACPTESFAREQFKKCNVEHYWDLAYSGAVLETASNEDL